MTTKEEVLRLCDEVGIDFNSFHSENGKKICVCNGSQEIEKFTKLIELAKAQGAEEERQRWKANMPDWQYVFSRSCQRAHPHDEMNKECREITKRLKAIRNRERKS